MPASIFHVATVTGVDEAGKEVNSAQWNSAHALTLNAVGSEISGAFDNGGGITFGLETNGSITAAAPAGAPSPINFSAGTTSSNIGSVVFSNSNGISFGLNGSTITGTVKTDYLTTARASTDAVGLNTAQTSVTWTVNSSGISIDAGAYLTTARRSTDAVGLNTAQTAVTWTVNSSGISIDAGAYLTTARRSTDAVGLNTAKTNVTWTVNSSGISLDAGGYLTTARGSTDAVGLNTAKTNVTWTVNSSGISIDAGGYAGTGFTTATTAGVAIVGTQNTAGLSLGVPAMLTTAALSTMGLYASSNTYLTSSGTHDARSLSFRGDKNITVGISASEVVFSVGNYLTTARASTDAVGLNTAQTAVTWTVNSSGISIDAGAYLTTARRSTDAVGLNTAKTNVTWTVNSSGISLNAGGYAGTGTSATNASITLDTNGLAISVAAPGAAAENNWINLLGNNTAGNTTASGSTIGLSGLNLTLSGANDSKVVISAPATSSLVGTSGISVSTNGSTISIQETPWSAYIVPQDGITIAGSAQAASSVSVFPLYIPRPLAFSQIKFLASYSYASAANTSSASQAYSASIVLYTRNSDTLNSVWSGKQNSNSFFRSNSTTALAGVRGINVTGAATTLAPDQYWAAVHLSTTNSGTGGNTTALGASVSLVVAVAQATAAMAADNWDGGATNQSRAFFQGQGLFATGATMATIGLTNAALSQTGNSATLAEVVLNFQNWTLF